MIDTPSPERLIALGLSRYEASVYLALLGYEDSTASEVADRAGVPRQRIYDVLLALRDKGLIAIREGRPARHMARSPAIALPALLATRQRAQALENERLARLIQQLVPDLEAAGDSSTGILARVLRASEDSIGGL
jgi:sugar-specific transcriptional regulator TrmB